MGYIGGGLLLAINLVMIMVIPNFVPGLDAGLMTRLSFVTVAIWWLVFTLPILINVKEPARRIIPGEEHFNPLQASFSRLFHTFKEISKYRELSLSMLAFWIYTNGIGTIIVMASVYGAELGIQPNHHDRNIVDGAICCSAICILISDGCKKNWHEKIEFYISLDDLYVYRHCWLFFI